MDCPVCKTAMIVLELHDVEIDFCTSCNGIWLDAGELEMLLEGASNRQTLLDRLEPVSVRDEPDRACPICDKRMAHVASAGASGESIILDKCVRGDGMWFDKGELRDVLRSGQFPAENKVFELLEGIFGSG